MKKIKTMIGICLLAITAQASADNIIICSDNNFWYPFTFTLAKDNKAAGLHIDIIETALTNLGHTTKFIPLPWKRCLAEAEKGLVDGVATASYSDARTQFLNYPKDAATSKESAYRVTQVEYIIVTSSSNPYAFSGDVSTLPQPVMAPKGYSVVDDLQQQGVEVDAQARGDENNIKKLLRLGKGSVVTINDVVKILEKKSDYNGKLKISETPLNSKSYYFPISKKSKLSAETINLIWEEIAKVRNDEALMAEMSAKY